MNTIVQRAMPKARKRVCSPVLRVGLFESIAFVVGLAVSGDALMQGRLVPFGYAYLAAALMTGQPAWGSYLGVMAGAVLRRTAVPLAAAGWMALGWELAGLTLIFLLFQFAGRRNRRVSPTAAYAAAAALPLLGLLAAPLPLDKLMVLCSAAASALMLFLFRTAFAALCGKRGAEAKPEEIAALIFCGGLLFLGLPGAVAGIALSNICCYALVLICAVTGGTAQGAVAGVAMGVMMALAGVLEPAGVASLALCGMMAGLVGKWRRWAAALAFVLANALATYGMNSSTQVLLRFPELLLAGGLVAFLPNKALLWFTGYTLRERRPTATQGDGETCARRAERERLDRYANAFQRLAQFAAAGTQEGREVLAAQFTGMERTVRHIGQSLERAAQAKQDLALSVVGELDREGIAAQDVVVLREEEGLRVHVTMDRCPGNHLCLRGMAGAVSRGMGMPMRPDSARCPGGDRCERLFRAAPAYDVVTGVAAFGRDGVCGDNHAFFTLPNGSCMIAVSDGMGCGAQASAMSESALTLAEQLYQAGFDDGYIFSTVNQVLRTRTDQETFATLDLCRIDQVQGEAEFIKFGAAASYLYREGRADMIAGSALPVGILDAVSPVMNRRSVSEGDYLVMVTDGIEDAVGLNRMRAWVAQHLRQAHNPQQTAEAMLADALHRAEGRVDDMTVLVSRVLHNRPEG